MSFQSVDQTAKETSESQKVEKLGLSSKLH